MRAKARGLAINPMTGGALVAVNLCPGREIVLVGLNGRVARHLAGNARVKRHMCNLLLHRQGRIGHSHRHVPPVEPRQKR